MLAGLASDLTEFALENYQGLNKELKKQANS